MKRGRVDNVYMVDYSDFAANAVTVLAVMGGIIALSEWRFKVLQRHFDDKLGSLEDCIRRLESRIDNHLDHARKGRPIK